MLALHIDDVAGLVQVGDEVWGWTEAQPFPSDLETGIRQASAALESADREPEAVMWAGQGTAQRAVRHEAAPAAPGKAARHALKHPAARPRV